MTLLSYEGVVLMRNVVSISFLISNSSYSVDVIVY